MKKVTIISFLFLPLFATMLLSYYDKNIYFTKLHRFNRTVFDNIFRTRR